MTTGSFSPEVIEVSDDTSDAAPGDGPGFRDLGTSSTCSLSTTMFSEYRILREESRRGLETAIVSGLALRGRTFSFNFGFFAGGSIGGGSIEGVGVGVGVDLELIPAVIPLSVAARYLRILAEDIRFVK